MTRTFRCSLCGQTDERFTVVFDDTIDPSEVMQVCVMCRAEHSFFCDACESWVLKSSVGSVVNGTILCTPCSRVDG